LEKAFQNILVRFQLIHDLPGRENPGRPDASHNGLGLEGGRVKAEIGRQRGRWVAVEARELAARIKRANVAEGCEVRRFLPQGTAAHQFT